MDDEIDGIKEDLKRVADEEGDVLCRAALRRIEALQCGLLEASVLMTEDHAMIAQLEGENAILEAENVELREALKELADCAEDNLTHRPEKRLERALAKAAAALKEK